MNGIFPLHIFPSSGLDNSIITSVYIGLIIQVFFTESFGWVFAGLVVPGYLASIFVIQPYAGISIVIEGIITYILVRGLSDYISKFGVWSSFFGRDRFFLFILVSVFVRIICEVWLLQAGAKAITNFFGIEVPFSEQLYSIGLVIVPLFANMFWKTGLRRGIIPVFTVTFLTYIILKGILIKYTNFCISDFELTYENVALDFLSSPKTYLVLLTGAFLGARYNLSYGWDYNGILIPALFAVAWFYPTKVFVTIGEVLLMVTLTKLIISKVPLLKTANLEGPRKIFIVFSVGYILKLVIGYITAGFWPGFKASDLFGFGYLMPSLVAVKILQKGNPGIVILPSMQTSITAVCIGSLIGFGLKQIEDNWVSLLPPADNTLLTQRITSSNQDLMDLVLGEKSKIIRRYIEKKYNFDLTRFSVLLKNIRNFIERGGKDNTLKEQIESEAIRLKMRFFSNYDKEEEFFILTEESLSFYDLKGLGIYIFNPKSPNNIIIEVPRPLSEENTLEGAIPIFKNLKAKAMIIAGISHDSKNPYYSDLLAYRRTPYQIAHEVFQDGNIIQIRSFNKENLEDKKLFIKKYFPNQLDINILNNLIGEIELSWEKQKGPNLQYDTSPQDFVILNLGKKTLKNLIINYYKFNTKEETIRRVEGNILSYIKQEKKDFKELIGNYQIPKEIELIYLEEEIISPLVNLCKNSNIESEDLEIIHKKALNLGYELISFYDKLQDKEYVILNEKIPQRKLWGKYIFKKGGTPNIAIEVPHPLYEIDTDEFGAYLFQYLDASYLFIAGYVRDINIDEEADVIKRLNNKSLFHLAHQVIHRENLPHHLPLIIQIRGISEMNDVGEDIVISTGIEINRIEILPKEIINLTNSLKNLGYSVGYFDGTVQKLPFKGFDNAQYNYTKRIAGGKFIHLWISSHIRQNYFGNAKDQSFSLLMETLGFKIEEGRLLDYIFNEKFTITSKEKSKNLSSSIKLIYDLVSNYIDTNNPEYLKEVKNILSQGIKVIFFNDLLTAQSFFIVTSFDIEHPLICVINAKPKDKVNLQLDINDPDFKNKVNQALHAKRRALWITI